MREDVSVISSYHSLGAIIETGEGSTDSNGQVEDHYAATFYSFSPTPDGICETGQIITAGINWIANVTNSMRASGAVSGQPLSGTAEFH